MYIYFQQFYKSRVHRTTIRFSTDTSNKRSNMSLERLKSLLKATYISTCKNVESSCAKNPSSLLQITQLCERWGSGPVAADELSIGNFWVCAQHREEKDFICCQNVSYSFESLLKTAGHTRGLTTSKQVG